MLGKLNAFYTWSMQYAERHRWASAAPGNTTPVEYRYSTSYRAS
ncbi:hypothetical protein [Actinophytocola sp.]